MSVKLRKRKNSDGTTSLRLDIYKNGERTIETLKHLQLAKPSSLIDREQNKKRMEQAEAIALKRASQLEATNYNMATDAGKKTIVTDWMQSYVDNYKKKDVRMMQAALERFKTFLKEQNQVGLTFMNLTTLMIEDFMEFLDDKSYGEGAMSYYKRFKKMVKQACRKLVLVNPTDNVEKKLKGKAEKKDILTLDELKILAATQTASAEVRRAFLFCCVTGIRWGSLKNLKWSNIRLESKEMNIVQSKTDVNVFTPLNNTAIKLLGEQGKKDDYVFKLPSHSGATKTLRAWIQRAGIDKKIRWNNSRHSFGTNLIYHDVPLLTASKLMGHTSTKHTQRYVDAAREMKEAATNRINIDL